MPKTLRGQLPPAGATAYSTLCNIGLRSATPKIRYATPSLGSPALHHEIPQHSKYSMNSMNK